MGTAHAVEQALDLIPPRGEVLIACGDTPLLQREHFQALLDHYRQEKCQGVVLTADMEDPHGYGRIIRDSRGNLCRIVEERDATAEEKKVREINTGTYCVEASWLRRGIKSISNKNLQGEYYLTDLVGFLVQEGQGVSGHKIDDYTLARGINNRLQLAEAGELMQKRINETFMLEGVTLVDPRSVYIDITARIGKDTVILPGTLVQGETVIGENCLVGPGSRLVDSCLGDGVTFQNSIILGSTVGDGAQIGPYAYIRPGSSIGSETKIGDFVEIKKSTIGQGSKVPHLSYVGDATIGKGVNLGAGTIIVNYDGAVKHPTVIEDGVFVGCNSNLIAPLNLGRGAYVGAGSTINKDVPADALALGRAPQVNKAKVAKKIRASLKIKKLS